MKTTVENSSAAKSAAREIEACAARWVVRERDGLDPAEERKLAAWLAAEATHAEVYGRLAAMAGALQRARAAGAGGAILAEVTTRERKRRNRRRALAAVGGAATCAVLAFLWTGRTPPPTGPVQAVAVRGLEPIRRLPDGSIVELNTGADLVVEYTATLRRVTLRRGEALFRVEKDTAWPFVVQAGNVAVRAVGTAFSVRLEGNSLEVLVTEGKVTVADAVAGRTLLPAIAANDTAPVLAAGQRVKIGEATGLAPQAAVVESVAAPEVASRLAWRISRLEFAGISLSEAVAQINRVNTVQISLADEAMGRLRISGTFAPDDPATFARLAAVSLGLDADDRGDGRIVLRDATTATKRE
jgi:transmembrane sensor